MVGSWFGVDVGVVSAEVEDFADDGPMVVEKFFDDDCDSVHAFEEFHAFVAEEAGFDDSLSGDGEFEAGHAEEGDVDFDHEGGGGVW